MENDPHEGLDAEERAYIGLHDAMMKMYANNDGKGCFKLASQLLTKANLPVLIRARCYMMLSLKHGPLAVQYAETAVSLLDNDLRTLVLPEAFPTKQLELAQRLLARAKARELPVTASSVMPLSATEQHGQGTPGALGSTSLQNGEQPPDLGEILPAISLSLVTPKKEQ